jgi:CubicO group peptidase (beta-lactamase class C family)
MSRVSELRAQLEERLDQAIAQAGAEVPGVAVGLVVEGADHVVTRGVTSLDAPVEVDADTLFQVGSTGKTVTAVAVLALRERGLLDLDVPVRNYVPELRLADEQALSSVTARHLLTHTAGHDGDLFEPFGGGDDCLSRFAAGMDALAQLAPVGTWSYSNAGFSLLGRVVERLTGLTYEEAVAELVLRPLGMSHSVFAAADAITHRVAVGHGTDRDGAAHVTRPWALPRTSWPAGGLVSSVTDQLRYARFHLGMVGEKVLPRSVREEMRTPQGPAGGGRAVQIGLSWLLQATPGVIAHGGSANGQESSFVLVPGRDFAITVLTNSSAGARVHVPLVKWALREVAGVVAPRRTPPEPVDRSVASFVAGAYHCRHAVLDITAGESGLQLAYRPTEAALAVFPTSTPAPASPLVLHRDDSVLVTDGPLRGSRGEVVRDDSGQVQWLRLMGRLHTRASGR